MNDGERERERRLRTITDDQRMLLPWRFKHIIIHTGAMSMKWCCAIIITLVLCDHCKLCLVVWFFCWYIND